MIKIKILIVVSLLLISFQTPLFGQGFPAPSVNVIVAEIRPLAPVAWGAGVVVSRNSSRLAVEVAGRLEDLAELGDYVVKGSVLAQIDDIQLKTQLRENQASVDNALSRLKFLDSEVKRKSSLAKRNLSAITDLDETVSLRDVAQGDFNAARARLTQTEQNIQFARLKAPFDGVVTERLANLGEYVQAGTSILRLVETDNLEASLFVPITAYRFLKKGSSLSIQSSLGKGIAPIKSIVPVADSQSHLMEVRLDMSQVDWPIGLDIKVAVTNGPTKDVIAVPRDALVLRRNGISIYKIKSDNTAEQINVEVGVGAGELVQVVGDVMAGDRIVVRGAERLSSGQQVTIKTDNHKLISGKQ